MVYIELELGLARIDEENPRFVFETYPAAEPYISFFLRQGYEVNVGVLEEE